MVSRRNFFSIVTMMAALFFIFQFSQIFKEMGNRFDVNEYAQGEVLSGNLRWQDAGYSLRDPKLKDKDYVLFLGDRESSIGSTVVQWCTYTKRNLVVVPEVLDISFPADRQPEMILIDSEAVNYNRHIDFVLALAETKVPIVFCSLPDPGMVSSSSQFRRMLGIDRVQQLQVDIAGVHLFPGFLLGGEAVYKVQPGKEEEKQDLALSVPWYVMGKGTKTYMAGMMEDKSIDQERCPGLIWRNTYGDAPVFVVSGDYMSGLSGLGILDAFVYEMNDYELHPMVNAYSYVVADYPNFAPENEEMIQQIYGRKPQAVLRDVMWPSVSAMAERNGLRLTCCINPQYDYGNKVRPSAKETTFYLQQMKEIGAEAGKSLVHGEGVTLSEKLELDGVFYRMMEGDYYFSAAYAGETVPEGLEAELAAGGSLETVRTLSCADRGTYPLLSYYSDEVTLQCVTERAEEYSYSRDLQARSLATALGYSHILIDMHNVMWPESMEDQWQHYFDEISSNVSSYWNNFEVFSRTALTESDAKVRTFLNLDYETGRLGNTISIDVTNGNEDSWFLLRTHDEEVLDAQGAEYIKIEKDAYLIHLLSDKADIQVGQAEEVLQFRY